MATGLQRTRIATLSALLLATAVCSASLQIEEVSIRAFQKADFITLREYFTGESSDSGRLVLRTDADIRDGLYFVVEIADSVRDIPEGSEVVLEIIRADTTLTDTFEFKVPAERPRSDTLLLGLTGEVWTAPFPELLAWRVQIKSVSGEILASSQSFLWGR